MGNPLAISLFVAVIGNLDATVFERFEHILRIGSKERHQDWAGDYMGSDSYPGGFDSPSIINPIQ